MLHSDKNDIKLAQDKIEAALEQMNKVSLFLHCFFAFKNDKKNK